MFKRVLTNYNQLNLLNYNQNLIKNQFLNQQRFFIKRILKQENRSTLKLFALSFVGGIGLITYLDLKNNNNNNILNIKTLNKEWDHVQRKINDDLNKDSLVGCFLDSSIIDNLKINRKIDGKNSLPNKRLILLQYRNCPFCCKVKTFLDYYDIPHEIVEVNPLTRKQIKFSNYRKVPILLIEDKKLKEEKQQILQLNDSSCIISVLGTYLFCNPQQSETLESIIKKYESLQYVNLDNKKIREISNKYFLLYGDNISPNEFKNMEEQLLQERKYREWTDQKFVHVLSPNIYRTTKEAVQAFNYFSSVSNWEDTFSTFERLSIIYIGSYAMYLISKYLKKKYQLKDDVRQSLYDDCNYFLKSKGKNDFMGGKQPNLSDLSVYGVLSSIEGCAAFSDLINNTKIGIWYFKMKNLVDNRSGSNLLKI